LKNFTLPFSKIYLLQQKKAEGSICERVDVLLGFPFGVFRWTQYIPEFGLFYNVCGILLGRIIEVE
jgi:hypothetical protein